MGRIEISTDILGGAAVSELKSSLASFIGDAEDIISGFKTVKNSTLGLNDGVGNLQEALDNVESRVRTEENQVQDAKNVSDKINDFVLLAVRTDEAVSGNVDKNKNEFYQVNPWLKPAVSVEEELPWYEQAWNWLCDTGEAIADGAKQVWNWVSDTAVKAWNGIVAFYQEHEELIWKIVNTVLIVAGAVLAIAAVITTGGTVLAGLVPLLATIGFSSTAAAAISATVAILAIASTFGSGVLDIIDIWAEIDNPVFNASQKACRIISIVTTTVYSIGGFFNYKNGISKAELKTFRKQNYTRDEIRVAVKQDACIKKFPKKLAEAAPDQVNTVKGNYAEMMQDRQMRIDGYKRVSNKPVTDFTTPHGKGIDGVYSNGKDYIVGEAKFGSSPLGMTKDGRQMSPTWIENRLDNAVDMETKRAMMDEGYTAQVFRVDRYEPEKFLIKVLGQY